MSAVNFPLLNGPQNPPSVIKAPTDWGTTFAQWDIEPLTFSPLSVLKEITFLAIKIVSVLCLGLGIALYFYHYADLKERVTLYKQYEQNVKDRQELHKMITVKGEVPYFKEFEYKGVVGLKTELFIPKVATINCITFQQALPEVDPENKRMWRMGCDRIEYDSNSIQDVRELTFDEVKKRVAEIQQFAVQYGAVEEK